jgi:hypothetical protein
LDDIAIVQLVMRKQTRVHLLGQLATGTLTDALSVDARPVEAAQIAHACVRRINIEHTMAPGYGRVQETRWHSNVASVSSAEGANGWFFEHVLLPLQRVELNSQFHSARHGRLLGVWNA